MEYKNFLSYEEQIKLLREKNLIIDDENYAVSILKRLSYFNLINGYKKPFKSKTGEYKSGTHFEDIYALYCFDNDMRHTLMKYLLVVELHIKSLLSYSFCEKFGEGQSEYQNGLNYNYVGEDNQKKINRLIYILSEKVNSPEKVEYVKHQENEYNNIPLWVLVKTLTFGNISKMYSCQKPEIQSKISMEFSDVNEHDLERMLDIITRYRNVCAHNERLFDFKYKKVQITENYIHRYFKLDISRKSGSPLFDVIIILKYLLEKTEFESLVDEIKLNIESLSKLTNLIQVPQLLKLMGFPQNWCEIKTLVKKTTIQNKQICS